MPGISEEDIRRVREATDLVSLMGERSPVRQRGRDFWCCCPFHEERTPSCKIDPSTQLWHCFGCGEGGDVYAYVMKSEDLSFPEAVRWLAERAGIQIVEEGGPQLPRGRKARLKEACKKTAEFYHTQLMRSKSPEAAAARAYLSSRRLGGSVPKDWCLGFAPGHGALVRHLRTLGFTNEEMAEANVAYAGDGRGVRDRFFNRIMFPIRDAQGDFIAFGGRVVGKGEPKYLNSQETPIFHKSQVLYGLDKAKASMASTGVAIVVEGYTDVISLSEAGIGNVVATLGTSLTMQHIRALSRHAKRKIVYLFDGDAAGQRAADRALGFIDRTMTPEAGKNRVELAAVTLPDDLDPADFVAQRGADALRALIDDAQPLLKFGIERRLAQFDLSTAEGRAAALDEALSVLAPIKDSLLAKDYAVQIAGRVRAREDDVLSQLERLVAPSRGEDASQEAAAKPAPKRAIPENERSRLRFEREFLGLVVRHSEIGQEWAQTLAQTNWHARVHADVAGVLLDILSESPGLPAAEFVAKAQERDPRAARVLTAATMEEKGSPSETAAFLAEELSIGDAEDAVEAMHEQLRHPELLSREEYEMIFQTVVGMQKDLSARRLAHRPRSSGAS